MICIDSLNIGLNRYLLLAVGLWPYQQSELVQLQLISFFGVLTMFILFQLTTLLISQCTTDLFVNIFSTALFFITLMITYSFFRMNIEVVKCLLEQLQHIYNELIDENEMNIIKQYAISAKCFTTTFIWLTILLALVVLSYPIWSSFTFGILLPINETRLHPSPLFFMIEYFVIKEQYFFFIILHVNIAFIIGSIALLATGTLFIVYILNACGMFRIARYRVQRIMTIKTLQKNSLPNENLIYMELICAVDMHRKAMKYSHSILSRFKVMFSLLLVVSVACESLNLFRIFQVISFGYGIEELMLRLIFIIVHVSYVFLGNYFGQEIIDHNNDIFIAVYNIQWYIAPLKVQKMILFLLQRSSKAFTMNIAGMFVGSLESAAMLLSTVISYFTVLYSARN